MSLFIFLYMCKQQAKVEVNRSAFIGVERVIFLDDKLATGGELTDVV